MKNKKRAVIFFASHLFLLIALSCFYTGDLSAQIVRYIKPVASGTGNGSSWANASNDLQGTINASAVGDTVFVAAGTYQPASGQYFSMKEAVKIYGGFAGTETLLSQRNWVTNVTILQGNNSRVVYNYFMLRLTSAALLDGFTLTGGNSASGGGGGMSNDNCSSKEKPGNVRC